MFDEKSRQLDTGTLSAFGIYLQTRHNKAQELIEMLQFAQASARANLHQRVESVFYDSNACLCQFTFRPELNADEEDQFFQIAMKTISQFEWDGAVFHGNLR